MKRSRSIRFVFLNFPVLNLSRISRFEFRVSPAVAQKCARPKSSGFKMRAAAQTAGQRGSKMRADASGRTCSKSPIAVSSPKTQKSVNPAVLNTMKLVFLNLFRVSCFGFPPIRDYMAWPGCLIFCTDFIKSPINLIFPGRHAINRLLPASTPVRRPN